MSRIARFGEYAAAFEKAFESDDWSVVEPYLTEDVVYDAPLPPPFGGRPEGREAVLAYFKEVLDALDRRFATRRLRVVEGPTEEDDSVRVRGAAIYTAAGVPDLEFELTETAHFRGDRIARLEDHYDEATLQQLQDWIRDHGGRLGVPGER